MSLLKKKSKAVVVMQEPDNGYRNRGFDAAVPQEVFEEYTTTGLLTENFSGEGYELVSLSDGSVTRFSEERVLVGCRKESCDFVIRQDPKNHKVSREHAYLLLNEGKLFVKDISANGTFLGGPETADKDMFRLPKDTEVEVRDGQVLRFADEKYLVRYAKSE